MKIKKIIIWLLFVHLITFSYISIHAETTYKIPVTPWPEVELSQNNSIIILFGQLEFSLPHSMTKRISVLPFSFMNLSITPIDEDPLNFIQFGIIEDFNRHIVLYKEKGALEGLNVYTMENFFDVLGDLSQKSSERLKNIHKIMGVKGASQYRKYVKHPFIAYSVIFDQPTPLGQTIYILLDGDKDVYTIKGKITDKQFNHLLSGLSQHQWK